MNKKFFLWLFIVGVVVLLGNLAITIWATSFPPEKTDWLTFVSGWISGIATFVVGVIAFRQNKEYTLYSIKNNKLNDINIEKTEIIYAFNNLAQFSKYIQFLKPLFENSNNDYNFLNYKLELDVFRDDLLCSVFKFQSYSYMPINMEKIVKKVIEIIYNTFETYEKLKDKKLSVNKREELLNNIGENALVWTNSIIAIRRDAIKEIEDLKKEIYCCQNLLEIEKIIENTQQETQKTITTLQKHVEQIQEKTKNL